MPTSGIVAGAGKSKDEVMYRHMEQCQTCTHFYPLNSCDVVAGNISTDAVCDLWAIKPPSKPKDGGFYKAEFEKAQPRDEGGSRL